MSRTPGTGAYIVMEWAAGETLRRPAVLGTARASAGRPDDRRGGSGAVVGARRRSSRTCACRRDRCGGARPARSRSSGSGIDAALSGTTDEDPVLADTSGLGWLLYAALTGCWPGTEYPSLPPAPLADGEPRSPRQVVAGIPLTFSDLACRAMQLTSREGSPGDHDAR